MDRDCRDFHARFQYMFYTWVQNCTLIESFFNKILNVKHAKACFSSNVKYRAVIRYLYLKGKTSKENTASKPMFYRFSAPFYA